MEKTDGRLMRLYELEDCYGRNFSEYSLFYHLMVVAYDGINDPQIIPFSTYSKELMENYGSINGLKRDLQKYYPGSGIYYYIDEVPATAKLRNCLRFSSIKFLKTGEFSGRILEKKYFTVKTLKLGRSKKAKELNKLGIKPQKMYLTKDPLKLSYTKPDKDYEEVWRLDFNEFVKIREKGLEDFALTEDNLHIYSQQDNNFTEISLEDALTCDYEYGALREYNSESGVGKKIHTYYEYDPLCEKNPGYGSTVEFAVMGRDEEDKPIYKATDKILQNENDVSYALRIIANEIRVFNRIPDGEKGKQILAEIEKSGKSDRVHEFVDFELANSRPGIKYYIEAGKSLTKDRPYQLSINSKPKSDDK